MNRRFTPDRKSFEQFLAAASLVQQLRKQALCKSTAADHTQPLMSLLQLQRGIHSGAVDLESAMSGVVELVVSVTGAHAAGVWLFRNTDEFSCCARIGHIYDPDRLGADILSRLARANRPDSNSLPDSTSLGKASRYPGYPNSVAVAALRIGGNVLGAVAALSTQFDAFSARDLDNLDFLASLLARAIQTTMRSGCHQAIALEQTALLQLLESKMPLLKEFPRQIPEPPSQGPAVAPITDGTDPVPVSELVQPGAVQPEFSEFDLAQSAKTPLYAGADRGVENISLPGVGVRAALGDVQEYTGVSEPFFLWSAMRRAGVHCTEFAVSCGAGVRRVAGAALIRAHSLTSKAMSVPGRVARYRPALPTALVRFPLTRFHDSFVALTSQTVRVRMTGWRHIRRPGLPQIDFSRIWNASGHLLSWWRPIVGACRTVLDRGGARFGYGLRSGRVQARALRRRLHQAKADLSIMLAEQRIRKRSTSPRQKNMAVSSGETRGNILRRTGKTLAEVATYAGHSTEMVFATIGAKVSAISFNKRALRQSTSALVVLTAMAVFLALQANFRNSFRSQPVDAATASSTRRVSGHSKPGLATASKGREVKTGATSHLEITDNSVKDSLGELTKYEVATLQRAAGYGDDDAAFQLGMAYETGYYVRQNCSRAAHWVKVAAEAGNSAAAYNLGLRYRYGDGLPADDSAAEHWLQIASKQKYSPAGGQ